MKFLKGLQSAYIERLGGDGNAAAIISDLRKFCNATKSNFSTEPLEMARMEGRREVFMRIANFLNVDFSDIYNYEEDYLEDE